MNNIYDGLTELEIRNAEAKRQFEEAMRSQERLAIMLILETTKITVQLQKFCLQLELDKQAETMQGYVAKTMVEQIKEAYTGTTATQAEKTLKSLEKPNFKAPIKC